MVKGKNKKEKVKKWQRARGKRQWGRETRCPMLKKKKNSKSQAPNHKQAPNSNNPMTQMKEPR